MSSAENGSVTADKTSAEAGATVTLTLTAAENYEFKSLSVTDASGAAVTTREVTAGTSYTFTMPESNVTVSATFKEIPPTTYTVTVSSSIANGTVSASPTTAEAGATVTLTAAPASGYELEAYSVTDANTNAITVTEEGTFTMPASSVTVSATFTKTAETLNQEAADAVIAKINAIGRVAYTDACKEKIDDARSAYDALTEAQQVLVTNYDTLTEAESTYESLITYTVTLTGGANATASGGATTQSDLSGAMTTVTYTANDGYYFADFTATTTNGITLTRTSSSVVTVSGTPTTDTSITVPDAAQIVPVTGITLNKTSTTITAGSTETLSVSAYEPGNATFQTVTWSSDNTAVANVDASTGLVTAVAAGENGSNASATITATATDGSGITATCTVTVTPLSVDVDNRGFTASSWENGIGGNLITE